MDMTAKVPQAKNHLFINMTMRQSDRGILDYRKRMGPHIFTVKERNHIREDTGWLGLFMLEEFTYSAGKSGRAFRANVSDAFMSTKHRIAEGTWTNKRQEIIKKGYLYITRVRADNGGEIVNIYIAVPDINGMTAKELFAGEKQEITHP